MGNQPKIEKHLNRASSLCCVEVGRFIDNIERTIASVRQVREIGLKKLQDSNVNKNKKIKHRITKHLRFCFISPNLLCMFVNAQPLGNIFLSLFLNKK